MIKETYHIVTGVDAGAPHARRAYWTCPYCDSRHHLVRGYNFRYLDCADCGLELAIPVTEPDLGVHDLYHVVQLPEELRIGRVGLLMDEE